MDDSYTMKEAARIYELNINTLYKYIQQGKIKAQHHTIKGKKIKKITKSDIEQFLGINGKTKYNNIQHDTITDKQQNTIKSNDFQQNPILDNILTKDNLKEVFKEFIEEQKAELIKPLEEHALVKYGALSTENKFLKERLETVIEENTVLRASIKALPGPVEEIVSKITLLEEEKETLLREKEAAIQQATEALHMVQTEKEQVIHEKDTALHEKDAAIQTNEKTIQDLQAEKERELQELKELKAKLEAEAKEKENLKTHLEEKEKEQAIIVDAWKKRLEESEKPWWRKIFG